MKEVWKPIAQFNGRYDVSNKGRIRSWINMGRRKLKTPEIRKTGYNNCGYEYIVISYKSKQYTESIHRLVAITFIPNPENKPCVNHIDGDKTNNHASNLEWMTHKENTRHGMETGLISFESHGEKNGMSRLTRNDVLDIRNTYRLGCVTQQEIADAWGLSSGHVNDIINKRRWGHV